MSLEEFYLDEYRTNGFVRVRGLVSRANILRLKGRIEEICNDPFGQKAQEMLISHEFGVSKPGPHSVRRLRYLSVHDSLFKEHSTQGPVSSAASRILECRAVMLFDHAIMKPPRIGSERPLHQDNAHFRVKPPGGMVSCWCSLDHATVKNGCLYYVPGSHLLGSQEHSRIEGTPFFSASTDSSPVPVTTEPGDCIFHHGLVLHSSPGNSSPFWRRAIAAHYVCLDAMYTYPAHRPAPIPIHRAS